MRFYETTQIQISDDISNAPQNIKFQDSQADTDITSLKHTHDGSDAYPVGTTSVPMGQITTGLFLWLKPALDVGIILSGGSPITIKGGKATKMWASFTSLQIVVPSTPQNLVTPVNVPVVIGG